MNLLHHLRTLEERLLDPATRRDPLALTHLLTPEFLEFGKSGRTFTRDQILAELSSEPNHTPTAIEDVHLQAATDTWALLTYRTVRHSANGAIESLALRSSLWVLRDERWQILFHQGTPQSTPDPHLKQRPLDSLQRCLELEASFTASSRPTQPHGKEIPMEQPDTSTTTGNIVGFFEDPAAAEQAVRALHEAGFPSAHLGVAHPGAAEKSTANNPSPNENSVSDVAHTIGRKTEELWDKVTDILSAGTRESDFTTDHTDPARPDPASTAHTSDPVQPHDGLSLNEDLSHFVTNETGASSLGAVVTVKATGRESEAEAILRNLGADLGDTPSA